MTLIPISTSKITLPDLKLKDIKIGDNRVLRFAVKALEIEATAYDSYHDSWHELRTEISPYERLYLRKSGKRREIPDEELCLEPVKSCEIESLNEDTKLRWVRHPAMNDSKEPDEIVASWRKVFEFKEASSAFDQDGLRIPQLGALHAISAHFSLKRNSEPATVVLPTGVGKTELMLSTMVYRRLPKILILVPSDQLRSQISEKFYGLGKLSQLGVITPDTDLPAVVAVKHGVRSISEADELLLNANVFVATANVLNSSDQEAIDHLCRGISDLFIDEAHHISAPTWMKVRDRFIGKRVVQFTATPFRNDGSALGGRIVYNYTMGEAQKADYFRHINLISVEEYYREEGDGRIAESAINRLRTDLEQGYDHLLMARVENTPRADELLRIYKDIAPDLNPIVVYSKMMKNDASEALSMLRRRESKVVICVKMLGEGFDLPNLKVAAIHDIHKSLPVTLQFIGRFTRQSINVGDASVIVNIAEIEVEDGLQHLYAQGADWDGVLRRLSENRVEREIRLQEVVERLKEKGNLYKQIPLWNLRPSFKAVLFKTTCGAWYPERFQEALPKNNDHWFAVSEDENLLVVLALHQARFKFGKFKELNDSLYKLLIVHWDKERAGLFVFSNDYEWFRVGKMAESLCNTRCELLCGPRIFNLFDGMRYPLVKNLGASQTGAISFSQYFGSNVTEGLSRIESAKSNLSNMAALGYDNGEKVIWGCSQKKGKVWSVDSGSIPEWMAWAKTAWDKVASGDIDEQNITRDFLRPDKLSEPYAEHAIAVQWGEHIQNDLEEKVEILFGDTGIPLYLVDIKIISQEGGQPYHIEISSDMSASVYEFRIDENLDGGFGYKLIKGRRVSVKRGSDTATPVEEYLQRDPWIIQYVDGSFSYNCWLIKLPPLIGEFDADQIDCWDWSGIDLKKESMGKNRAHNTVQSRTFEQIQEQYDVIVNDDGKGEAADLVGLKIVDDKIHLGLVHCKFSKKETPGARIDDLYDVCGQAQKSIRWKHGGIPKLYGHIKGREKLWRKDDFSRFLKGTISDFSNIKRLSRTMPVKLHVYMVQPGLKKSKVTSDMLRVIGSTSVYLKNTAQADLIVVGS